MIAIFEFDESVSNEDKLALAERESANFIISNIAVGDHIKLYPKGSDDGKTFRCTTRRHVLTPDEHGDAQIVFVLGSI